MKIWGMVLGGYPRGRYARYALRDKERGSKRLSEANIDLVKAHSEIIGVQKAAGFHYVVDGMIDWHDIFRPFVESWRNAAVDGLLRYFDNNFFYRIPVFTGEPDITEPVLARRVLEYALLADPSKLKIVVPGPITFTKLSKNRSGYSDTELAEKIAYVLRREIELALEAGAGIVQIDEPFLASMDADVDDAALAVDLVNMIVDGFEDKAILALYFDAPQPRVYERLLEVRAKYLMIDVADVGERALGLLESKGLGGHAPVLGLIDARRIYDDDLDKIVSSGERVRRCCDPDELVITTTTWMDLIPYRYSLRKTFLLARILEEYSRKLGYELVNMWR